MWPVSERRSILGLNRRASETMRSQCMQAKRIKSLGRMPHTHTLYMYIRLWLELSLVFFTPLVVVVSVEVQWHTYCWDYSDIIHQDEKGPKNKLSIFVIFLFFAVLTMYVGNATKNSGASQKK